ncbi:MAG: endonuclease III, partial [Candidatus Scalindua sediminis]
MDHIDSIITILKRENKNYIEPIVTTISKVKSPFKVLISCLLSLRTKDKVTAEASNRLFKLASTPQQMLNISTKD